MLKRVIPILLLLCFVFGSGVWAENAAQEETIPQPDFEKPKRDDFNASNLPHGFDSAQAPQGAFTPPQMPGDRFSNQQTQNETIAPPNAESRDAKQGGRSGAQFGGAFPGSMGGFAGRVDNDAQNIKAEQPGGFLGFVKNYTTPIVSVLLLAFAYVFVYFYKRKNY